MKKLLLLLVLGLGLVGCTTEEPPTLIDRVIEQGAYVIYGGTDSIYNFISPSENALGINFTELTPHPYMACYEISYRESEVLDDEFLFLELTYDSYKFAEVWENAGDTVTVYSSYKMNSDGVWTIERWLDGGSRIRTVLFPSDVQQDYIPICY